MVQQRFEGNSCWDSLGAFSNKNQKVSVLNTKLNLDFLIHLLLDTIQMIINIFFVQSLISPFI